MEELWRLREMYRRKNSIFINDNVAQRVKASTYNAGDWVQSLGWEDLLEKEMAPHSSTFVWKIPWTEEPGRL